MNAPANSRTFAPLNEYLGYYQGKQEDIYASSMMEAKAKAINVFNPPKSKAHLVNVHLVKANVNRQAAMGLEA